MKKNFLFSSLVVALSLTMVFSLITPSIVNASTVSVMSDDFGLDDGYTDDEDDDYGDDDDDFGLDDDEGGDNPSIDWTSPTITGVKEGVVYTSAVTIKVTDNELSSVQLINRDTNAATDISIVNNTANYTISSSGFYKLVALDKSKNRTSVSFTVIIEESKEGIDIYEPAIIGVTDETTYNHEVTFTVTDDVALSSVKLINKITNDIINIDIAEDDKTAKYTVSSNGKYNLIAIDKNGNNASIIFTIDLSGSGGDNGDSNEDEEGENESGGVDSQKPVITGVSDGETYTDNVEFKVTDNVKLDSIKLKNLDTKIETDIGIDSDGKTSDYVISESGSYELIAIDESGNKTSVSFNVSIIDDKDEDTKKPVITGAYDLVTYYSAVNFTVTDDTALSYVKLTNNYTEEEISIDINEDGKTANYSIDYSGSYKLVAADESGNTTSIKFIVSIKGGNNSSGDNGDEDSEDTDTKKPMIDGVYDLVTYYSAVDFTVTDDTALGYVKLVTLSEDEVIDEIIIPLSSDGKTAKYTILNDGKYRLVAEDKSGNITSIQFIVSIKGGGSSGSNDRIDWYKPEIVGVLQSFTHRNAVDIVVTDNVALSYVKLIDINTGKEKNITIDSDGKTAKYTISVNGSYKLVAVDKSGNDKIVSFIISIKAPTIVGVFNGKIYKSAVIKVSSANSSISTVKLGNTDIKAKAVSSSGYTVNKDGSYTLNVTDAAGNKSTVKFIIDTKAPTFNLKNKGAYRTKKTLKVTDSSLDKIVLGGKKTIRNNTEFSIDDKYTVTATDKAGNSSTIVFYIDTKKPTIKGLSGTYVKKVPTIKVTDKTSGVKSITLDGKTFKSGTKVTKEGQHKLVAKDKAGNKVTKTFYYDKTKPVIKGASNGKTYTKPVTIKTSDKTSGVKSNILDGVSIKSGKTISTKGKHTLVVTDKAGNKNTITFTIK